MKIFSFAIIGLVITCFVPTLRAESPAEKQSQRYKEFESLLNARKPEADAMLKFILDWQKESPDETQLAVAWGNYYFYQAHDPAVWHLDAAAKGTKPTDLPKGVYGMQKEGSNVANGVDAVIDTRPRFDDALLTRGIAVLRDATTTHPERLDIWMGIAHAELMGNDRDAACKTLTAMTIYAHEHPKGLQFMLNKPIEIPAEKFLPANLHSYALRGYTDQSDEGLEFLLQMALLAEKYYPESPLAYNDEAVYYQIKGNEKKTLDALLRANKADPSDAIVTMNIATCYEKAGYKEKARAFYQKTIANAKEGEDADLKTDAQKALKKLGKH